MFVYDPSADVRTLRRIALLVLRAREDERAGNVRDRLGEIGLVIDRMKRSIVIGSPLARRDVASLSALVRQLPKDDAHLPTEIVRWTAFGELKDLVAQLRRKEPAPRSAASAPPP